MTLLKKVFENEDATQREVQECLNNGTKVLQNLSEQSHSAAQDYNPQIGTKFSPGIRKKCCYHATDIHNIAECNAFICLDKPSKFDTICKNGICFKCLLPRHLSRNCDEKNNKKTLCDIKENLKGTCGRPNH